MVKVTFYGHSCFAISDGKDNIIIDPFLTGNPLAKAKPDDLKVNYVLITHGHGDHLGDGIEMAKANDATIIAPFELAAYCQNQGAKIHPMHIGGGFDFSFGRVTLTIAHHGSGLPVKDGIVYLGNPVGFVVNIDGKNIYHAGDTGLFYDMKLIGEMYPLDLALLPIGDNFTMGIREALKAAELLAAKTVIPMHYNTMEVIKQDPKEFVNNLPSGINGRILKVGESYEF